jgi:8-oxo-dGTP pyrophosphatase MutT (NUDIX family)
VALDADDRVALVRQWRLPADAALLEIPAGGLDTGEDGTKEDPEFAARRELEEETGLQARTWRKLAAFYSAPGFTDELMHLFLATDLVPASTDERLGPDEDERLILEWRPWREAVEAVERGEIRDAKSIAGLFWLERLRREDRLATGGDALTVTYQLTVGEAVRAVVGLARRSIGIRLLGLFTIVITAIAALMGDLISLVGVGIGVAMVTGWAVAPIAWWQFHKRPDLVGAHTTLTVDEGGLVIDDAFTRGRTTWNNYRKVHDVAGCLLFDNAAGSSLVVPKRAFSDSQLGILYRLLDRHGLLPSGSRR